MASGSEQYSGINAGRKSRASARGNNMTSISARNAESDSVPF